MSCTGHQNFEKEQQHTYLHTKQEIANWRKPESNRRFPPLLDKGRQHLISHSRRSTVHLRFCEGGACAFTDLDGILTDVVPLDYIPLLLLKNGNAES